MSNIPDNVLIDECDREMLESMGQWRMHNQGYVTMGRVVDGKYTNYLMHRVIMNPPKGYHIDHINGVKTDNRRCNLRIVTSAENQYNRPDARGYIYIKQRNKWMAYLCVGYKFKNLGDYDTEEEAKLARAAGKEKYHVIVGYNPA